MLLPINVIQFPWISSYKVIVLKAMFAFVLGFKVLPFHHWLGMTKKTWALTWKLRMALDYNKMPMWFIILRVGKCNGKRLGIGI